MEIQTASSNIRKTVSQQERTRLVVSKYRSRLGIKGKPLSFARFAKAVSQPVQSIGLSVSYQTVKNWEDGIYRPDYFFTLQLANHAPAGTWQHAFALDILAVQWPELYQPGSEIGARLLQNP